MQKPALVVLAAGMGSRYGGLKQIDPMDEQGHAIIDYSVFDAKRAGFNKIIFVIKHEIEDAFKKTIGSRLPKDLEVHYAFQEVDALPDGFQVPAGREKPWGTGHAVLCAKPLLQEPFAVINADDYYGIDSFKKMADFLSKENPGVPSRFAMIGYHLGNTVTEHGYVSRGICHADDQGHLVSITERTHIERREGYAEYTEDDGATWHRLDFSDLVSMNFFGFQISVLKDLEQNFPTFLTKTFSENPLKGEYYIPTAASRMIASGDAVMDVLVSSDQWYGVTYPEDKKDVMEALAALRDRGLYPDHF